MFAKYQVIGYRAVLKLNLFFGNWWYTNMLTNSFIEVSNTISIIGLIAESTLKLINDPKSKVFFGNPILEKKVGLKEFGLGLIFYKN